jgi:hypothetical protein
MRIATARLATLLAVLICTAPLWPANQEQRIRLKPGATEARVTGRLTPKNGEMRYVIRGEAGQRLTVTLTGPGPFSAEVISPSGKQEGQPGGGVFFDNRLTETGDYRIRITEGNRGEKRSVRFVLKIQLR